MILRGSIDTEVLKRRPIKDNFVLSAENEPSSLPLGNII